MADWEISKAIGQCSGTGAALLPGQEYYGALLQGESGLERRDYSVEYWQQQRPQVYCFWRARMPQADRRKRLLVDDEMLMAFFERLADETEPEKISFRFVLTLVLMRRRRLRYEASRNDGRGEVWTMRVVGEDRSVEVVNPNLTEDQIEQLSGQVGQILQTDL